ncbi:hypothetical protein ACF07O_34535, partial [Streptomyces althioticus]
YDKQAYLVELNVENNLSEEINIPDIKEEDAIAYISGNPVNGKEMAFATFKKDVYVSYDKATQWIKVADQGKGIDEKNH